MGAWIEIGMYRQSVQFLTVAPIVGAWIEIKYEQLLDKADKVAPIVGAWIEIYLNGKISTCNSVAPIVGAWIEIQGRRLTERRTMSLLSWERGLKFVNLVVNAVIAYVAPIVGAWIEMIILTSAPSEKSCRSYRGSVD